MATLSDSQIAGVLKAAGFPADQIGTGVAIALAESGGRTDALNTSNSNGSWDAGLMQVNSIHGYSQQYLFDVQNNAAAALKIYKAAGNRWTPWSTYNSGIYRTFLLRGNTAAGNPAAVPPANSSAPASGGGTSNFSDLTMGGTWLRVGVFLLGGILLVVGLRTLVDIPTSPLGLARKALG